MDPTGIKCSLKFIWLYEIYVEAISHYVSYLHNYFLQDRGIGNQTKETAVITHY